ncbi:hypothetical protein HK096_000563, partial [Nowakowskiella sp. JEL0078]
MFVNAQVVVVWVINWIKLRALYDRNPVIKWGTAVICIGMVGTQFQYLFKSSKPTPDDLGRCLQNGNSLAENLHTGGDLAIRILLSGLFILANLKHSSQIKNVNSNERFMRLIKNDFRASFIDVIALLVKFVVSLANLPNSQTRFLFHIMDFAKAAGTHWFVLDISNGTLKSNGSVLTQNGHSGSYDNSSRASTIVQTYPIIYTNSYPAV